MQPHDVQMCQMSCFPSYQAFDKGQDCHGIKCTRRCCFCTGKRLNYSFIACCATDIGRLQLFCNPRFFFQSSGDMQGENPTVQKPLQTCRCLHNSFCHSVAGKDIDKKRRLQTLQHCKGECPPPKQEPLLPSNRLSGPYQQTHPHPPAHTHTHPSPVAGSSLLQAHTVL
jgi:hypothetical protein